MTFEKNVTNKHGLIFSLERVLETGTFICLTVPETRDLQRWLALGPNPKGVVHAEGLSGSDILGLAPCAVHASGNRDE